MILYRQWFSHLLEDQDGIRYTDMQFLGQVRAGQLISNMVPNGKLKYGTPLLNCYCQYYEWLLRRSHAAPLLFWLLFHFSNSKTLFSCLLLVHALLQCLQFPSHYASVQMLIILNLIFSSFKSEKVHHGGDLKSKFYGASLLDFFEIRPNIPHVIA